jgi:hypothetical protein
VVHAGCRVEVALTLRDYFGAMSGIGPVVPADQQQPVEEHGPADQDGKPLRRPPRRRTKDDLVEVEPHKLDLEA